MSSRQALCWLKVDVGFQGTVARATRRAKHFCLSEVMRNVQPLSQKYLYFRNSECMVYSCHLAPTRGTFGQSSRHVGRDAMDAKVCRRCVSDAYGQVAWYECRRFEVPAALAESSFRNFKSKAALENVVWPAPFAFRSSRKVDVAIAGELRKAGAGSPDAGIKSVDMRFRPYGRNADITGDGG